MQDGTSTNVNTAGAVYIQGNVTVGGNFTGRDSSNSISASQANALGFTVFEPSDRSSDISQELIARLQSQLIENRILILGDRVVDTQPEILYIDQSLIAYSVAASLKQENLIDDVYQWGDEEKRADIRQLLSNRTLSSFNRGVFIFFDISLAILDAHFLQSMVDQLSALGHYAILITNELRPALRHEEISTKYWARNISDIYTKEELTQVLRTYLNQEQLAVIEAGIDEIVDQLPSKVLLERFAKCLKPNISTDDSATIQTLIRDVHKSAQQESIERDYRQLKDEKAQLLVVGLALFGGLMESQFFVAMQKLIKGPWKYLFQPQEILDYYHLSAVEKLFSYRDIPESRVSKAGDSEPTNEQLVALRSANLQREVLLDSFRHTHRLHLVAALPIFYELVSESVAIDSGTKIEYSSQHKRNYLRRVLGESLSEIGNAFPLETEKVLLQLAAYTDSPKSGTASNAKYGVNRVAAEAIEAWFNRGESTRFYTLIKRWLIDGSAEGKAQSQSQAVQRTLAMAVSYAIQDCGAREIPQTLYDLSWKFACHRHGDVRNYFVEHIFPQLSAQEHRQQLLTAWQKLHPQILCIAQRGTKQKELIALFSDIGAEQITPLLQTWLTEWKKAIPTLSANNITAWTPVLSLAASTYQAGATANQLTEAWLAPWLDKIAAQKAPQEERALLVKALQAIQEKQTADTASSFSVEQELTDWLSNKQARPLQHTIALLYFAQKHKGNVAELIAQTPSLPGHYTQVIATALAGICTFSSISVLTNLLPIALVIAQSNADVFKAMLAEWRTKGGKLARLSRGVQMMVWLLIHRSYFRLRNWVLLLLVLWGILWFALS